MIINNEKAAIRIKLMKLFYIAVFFALVIIVLTTKQLQDYTGIDTPFLLIIVALIYVLFSIYRYKLELNYFYFNDETDKLIIRYYSLRSLTDKKQSIVIPKDKLYYARITSYRLSRKQTVTLYQQMGKQAAKYAPISITLLNKKEREDLITSLKKYAIKQNSGAS